mmetsp:Transcript_84494/g.242605  ORF Transcript_84494/g.242605 Transcript_84494/m.242605 type:complete len:405 (-) Transcript_84494:139-1353(-)
MVMMAGAGGRGRVAEDLALDVSRLMDGVREEVMALMLEGVQKSASFCASLCAERIVAARREMQRKLAEERRELERFYGPSGNLNGSFPVPSSPHERFYGSSPSPSPPGNAPSMLPPTRTVPIVCRPDVPQHSPSYSSKAQPTLLPNRPVAVVERPDLPQHMPSVSSKVPRPGPGLGSVHGHGNSRAAPLPATSRACSVGPTAEALQAWHPHSNGPVGLDNYGTASLDSYDATFIDAYGAVQSLEEQTNMAARAMDLLDEALQAAVEATSSTPSDRSERQQQRSSANAPAAAWEPGEFAQPLSRASAFDSPCVYSARHGADAQDVVNTSVSMPPQKGRSALEFREEHDRGGPAGRRSEAVHQAHVDQGFRSASRDSQRMRNADRSGHAAVNEYLSSGRAADLHGV